MNCTNKFFISIIVALGVISFNSALGMGADKEKIPQSWYSSKFVPPNKTAQLILEKGQILGPDEKSHQMIERVINTIALAECAYPALRPKKIISTAEFAQQLGMLMDERVIVMSTPILTNAGRFNERPLSACVMPPVDLKSDLKKIKEMADQYHQDGMGTGYNLDETDQPMVMLKYLNDIAVAGAQSKKEQRPVGNMAILDVHSPAIEEFVMAKVGADDRGEDWKFNISVNITDEFMNSVERNQEFTLRNGKKVLAKKLLEKIAYAAHQCGDPGLISLERLNKDNPTPCVSAYKSTAPCAEVGLAPGETCVFGYINLASFVTNGEQPIIDFDRLKSVIALLTRALDNILEISIQRYSIAESKSIMQAKRKIGIGVCGFADMLIALNLSYKESKSRELLQDILNFISYHSKEASIELAYERGSFNAIADSRYMDESFIMDKYGKITTPHVSSNQWEQLAKRIKETKLLRHATTTALPPTGRSAQVIGASTSIEPLFRLHTSDGIYPSLHVLLRKEGLADNPAIIAEIEQTGCSPKILRAKQHPYVTATEISPEDHLAMTVSASQVIDEAISKTINTPQHTTPQEIEHMYRQAFAAGLKGITIYRNGSRTYQPKKLSVQN